MEQIATEPFSPKANCVGICSAMTETLVDERSNGGNICGGADGLPLPHKIIHLVLIVRAKQNFSMSWQNSVQRFESQKMIWKKKEVQHVYKTVEIRLWKGLQATWSRLKLSLSLPKLTVTLVLVVWAKQFFSMGCFKSYGKFLLRSQGCFKSYGKILLRIVKYADFNGFLGNLVLGRIQFRDSSLER
ncbi:hypothetical protein V6N12_042318 [Hibiscus sabdariffa]|uniref:Uncharacterized protein n=1 Tax=Hibiscus sabdariffa TaxID=183260 RepID=A0ABR2EI50_9ROSI